MSLKGVLQYTNATTYIIDCQEIHLRLSGSIPEEVRRYT
jgi:hypothetical protein